MCLNILKLVDGKALIGVLVVKDIPSESPHKTVDIGLVVGEVLVSPIPTFSHCFENLFIGVLCHPLAYELVIGHFLHSHVVIAHAADAFNLLSCQKQLNDATAVLADESVFVMNTGITCSLAFLVKTPYDNLFIFGQIILIYSASLIRSMRISIVYSAWSIRSSRASL